MENNNYQGWKNYATWRVALEFFDGYEIQKDEPQDVYDLSKYFKELVESAIDESSQGISNSYAHAFISDVDFYQIAEHALDMDREIHS
jgi:hypothetical protein